MSDYLKLHFAGQAHESFAVLFLSAQNTMLAFEDMFRGTLTQVGVYPREVVKQRAAAQCLGGDPGAQPSVGQGRAVRGGPRAHAVLKEALALVDVQVLDHFVVANNRAASMAERGLV